MYVYLPIQPVLGGSPRMPALPPPAYLTQEEYDGQELRVDIDSDFT